MTQTQQHCLLGSHAIFFNKAPGSYGNGADARDITTFGEHPQTSGTPKWCKFCGLVQYLKVKQQFGNFPSLRHHQKPTPFHAQAQYGHIQWNYHELSPSSTQGWDLYTLIYAGCRHKKIYEMYIGIFRRNIKILATGNKNLAPKKSQLFRYSSYSELPTHADTMKPWWFQAIEETLVVPGVP